MSYKLAPKHLRRNEIVFDDSASNYIATDEERWDPESPPGGDTKNWFWTNATGWLFKGNAEDGTANKSSYINQDGQRVFYDNIDATSLFDEKLVNLKREMITGKTAWAKGGDQYTKDGMIYDRQTNPYVISQEMRDSANAEYERALEAQRIRDLNPNPQGWNLKAVAPSFNVEDAYRGRGLFTDETRATMNNAFLDVFDKDIAGVVNNFRSDWYNPFYGLNDNPEYIKRTRELDASNADFGKRYENRMQGNAMDWLFDQTKDNIGARDSTLRRFDRYVQQNGRDALYQRGMDRKLYEDMGLGDALGEYTGPEEWIDPRSARGMMSGLNGNQSAAAMLMQKAGASRANTPRTQRQNVWGAGNGLLSDENEAMRDAIASQLGDKLLG